MNRARERMRTVAQDIALISMRVGQRRLLRRLVLSALVWLPFHARSDCQLQAFEIPVHMQGRRPIAKLGLNGTEAPMLLDSGAFFSLLTESAASQLNLPLRRLPEQLRVEGVTGRLAAKLTRVDKVQLNGAQIANVEFIVGINELGAGIMGVMGRNFLSMADTEYDLAHGIVRLVFPKGECGNANFAHWAGNAPVNVVPLLSENGPGDTAIRVMARINGVDVNALMDTGASTTVKLRIARRAGIKDAEMVPEGRISGGGAGHAQSWLAPVAAFELGGEKISNNRLEIDNADGTDEDMLLGIDYFLSHHIYVSRLQHKLYATWNGGSVFARNKVGESDDAGYATAPTLVGPDDADALARRGQAAAARGDFILALADLDRACALAPQAAPYFMARASVHAATKQPTKALQDFDEALSLDPSLHVARQSRAALRSTTGDRPGALADVQVLDTEIPPSSPLRAEMGNIYARFGLATEALRQWDLWLSSHRNDSGRGSVLNGRCWLRARLKLDLQAALDDCRKAVREDEENASFQDSLGWTYLRLDDPARAIKAFDRAIKLSEASPWSYYGRAQAQRRLGHADIAQQDLAASRRFDPKIDELARAAGFDFEADPVATPQPASAAPS